MQEKLQGSQVFEMPLQECWSPDKIHKEEKKKWPGQQAKSNSNMEKSWESCIEALQHAKNEQRSIDTLACVASDLPVHLQN